MHYLVSTLPPIGPFTMRRDTVGVCTHKGKKVVINKKSSGSKKKIAKLKKNINERKE